MERPATTYCSPFLDADADSDTSEAAPRVDPPVTRSSIAIASEPAAEAENASASTQTTTVKRKRAALEHDIMGDDWEETVTPRKKSSKRAKKPRLHESEKHASEELPRVETETQITPEEKPDSETHSAELEKRHQKEMIERDMEVIALRARLNHDLVTKVDKPESQITIERLRAEHEATKKAHEEESARLTEDHEKEIADLKAKHASDLQRREDALEKQFHEDIRRSKAKEERKTEQEAAKLQSSIAAQEKAKVIGRNELLAVVLKRTTDIKMLYNRQRDGTIAQAKDSEVFPVQECVDGLTTLWAEQGALITRLLPHELSNDHDIALEFEAQTIVRAQAWMQSLELRSAPQELLQTGWSLSALHRLMCGLFPYHETDMTTLYTAVVDVHRILQEATAYMQGGYAPTMLPIPSQHMVATTGPLASPLPRTTHDQQFFPPPQQQQYRIAASAQEMPSQQQHVPSVQVIQPTPTMPLANTDFQQSSNQGVSFSNPGTNTGGQEMSASMDDVEPSFPNAPVGQCVPQNVPSFSTNAAPPAQSARLSYQPKACHNMRDRGQCFRGETCKFSHDPEIIIAAHGEGTGVEAMQDVDNRQLVPPATTAATTDDWRAVIPCRWVTRFGTCRTADCGFMHPAGTHEPGNSTASSGAQQCKTEERHGRCKNRTCNFVHQGPHGLLAPPGGDMPMAEDTMSNAGFQIQGSSDQQCQMEQCNGYCNRKKCNYTHQKAHGPQDSGPAQSINPFTRASFASRITFDNNDQPTRGVQFATNPPTGPRAHGGIVASRMTNDNNVRFAPNAPINSRPQGGSLESRMTFPTGPVSHRGNRNARPEQQLYNPRMSPAADSFTLGNRGGQQHGGRGGRGGRGRGNFSGHNVFQNGQGQGPQNSMNLFQGGGQDGISSQNSGRGRNNNHKGRGARGGSGRGRGGGGAAAGFGGSVPQGGGGGGMFGTGFGM
ncbi:hypothetical protein HBH49_120690 [Parastagonospora nodorum]|nr:hypothetical protein HBH49_120690 [Parastagonospora nodorum]